MSDITLIDTTLRDGNQSNWGATGLDTGMMLQIAPVMERIGFEAIDFSTSTHMAVAVRFKKEDPWERLRLFREAMPTTPLSFLTTGMRFISWEIASDELMEFAFRLLVNNGIRRFAVMDPMNNVSAMLRMAEITRKAGGESIVAALTFTLSPLHDDAHFTEAAKALAGSGRFDRLYLKDPGGLVTPERARTLIPALKAVMGPVPLEFHSHCTIGLGPFSYLEAAGLGAETLHTASSAAANGTSQPAMRPVIANLRDLGHRVDIDDEAVAEMDAYIAALAAAEGLTHGQPGEFDRAYFRHQMPGGMMGTMKRQLAEIKQLHRLPEVLEEVEHVRADLGYPIMVTPFSQVVGTQALMNVISGERYKTIPDEVTRYVLGRFGAPAMPLDGALEDRVKSSKRARELDEEPHMASLDELRAKIGKHYSDEEFLLRAVMPADQVDAMKAAGPARRDYNAGSRPVMALIRELTARKDLSAARIEKPGFSLELGGGR
ncbi:carboxylase [Sinisalibacter aestuarii]|uniref:Carboxylase n=1 Tax=Sinisalibacter aestuarii TaxID=2949426 RepID=A0ABQ5LYV4_9RHOB|nr:carboxylase [Sinisalibacter aestuarii]GKY90129.1 carboxylase [Sinisalibacter aestuarii]